ncbi:sensor domain-containing diguanylate cyclase [Roseixanthobacter glucoisosaccharinicivorans]|uniref:sensor domain-containing diguanylate cyclase n=1 Tax=Roseixanthobacter glucoisosaccharinicivorans TaxID=3119923 RepID=UPI003728DEEB
MIAENSGDVIIHVGADMLARYVSPSSTRLFGWSPEEMTGKRPHDFILQEHLPDITASVARMLAGADDGNPLPLRVACKKGGTVWVEAKSRAVRDPVTGVLTDFVLILRDITERRKLEAQLEEMARTDGLTKLANRRAFDEVLEREWRRTVRTKGQMSLVLIDIDNFKAFNDQYGHQVGDDCLRAVAAAIAETIRRPGDTAARYGGEEIAVVLPDTDATGACDVAERLRAAVEGLRVPHEGNHAFGCVTVSIGVATALSRLGGTVSMPESLLAASDAALYKAKHNGRNRIESGILLAPGGMPRGA